MEPNCLKLLNKKYKNKTIFVRLPNIKREQLIFLVNERQNKEKYWLWACFVLLRKNISNSQKLKTNIISIKLFNKYATKIWLKSKFVKFYYYHHHSKTNRQIHKMTHLYMYTDIKLGTWLCMHTDTHTHCNLMTWLLPFESLSASSVCLHTLLYKTRLDDSLHSL